MSSVAAIWSERPKIVGERKNLFSEESHNLQNDLITHESKDEEFTKWTELLRDRQERLAEVVTGPFTEDIVLDSPVWLRERLERLRSRHFQRINDPRRKHEGGMRHE